MCFTGLLRMLFQSALTVGPLVVFPINHCERGYKDLVRRLCSYLGRLVVHLWIVFQSPSEAAQMWQTPGTGHRMLIHSGTTMSHLPFVALAGTNMKPSRRYLHCGHTNRIFLAIITFT